MATTSPWFMFDPEQSRPDATFRLFCFHYAGGGASIFRPWIGKLSDQVELIAVQLPGRENRLDEPLVHAMELVTGPLADALPPLLDKPFALFGHSTGALICFELSRVLRKRALRQPRLLIASGQDAPRIKPAVLRHRLSDADFVEVIRNCNGTPDSVLGSPALLELLLPRIRADGAVYETYSYERQPPLDCRIVVFHGLDDGLVSDAGLVAWSAETRHSFRRYGFPGGHFFVHEAENEVVAHINRELQPFLGKRVRSDRRTDRCPDGRVTTSCSH